MKKLLLIAAIILGILLVFVSIIYFIEPAKFLPNFFPGFDHTLSKHHYKHGIGALLLGIGCFVYVWFGSNKKLVKKESHAENSSGN